MSVHRLTRSINKEIEEILDVMTPRNVFTFSNPMDCAYTYATYGSTHTSNSKKHDSALHDSNINYDQLPSPTRSFLASPERTSPKSRNSNRLFKKMNHNKHRKTMRKHYNINFKLEKRILFLEFCMPALL